MSAFRKRQKRLTELVQVTCNAIMTLLMGLCVRQISSSLPSLRHKCNKYFLTAPTFWASQFVECSLFNSYQHSTPLGAVRIIQCLNQQNTLRCMVQYCILSEKSVGCNFSSLSTSITLGFFDAAIWLIKRTFQPSIIRKKRKTGFLVRQRTVGGRRVLKRRKAKGRWRLGGGIWLFSAKKKSFRYWNKFKCRECVAFESKPLIYFLICIHW